MLTGGSLKLVREGSGGGLSSEPSKSKLPVLLCDDKEIEVSGNKCLSAAVCALEDAKDIVLVAVEDTVLVVKVEGTMMVAVNTLMVVVAVLVVIGGTILVPVEDITSETATTVISDFRFANIYNLHVPNL